MASKSIACIVLLCNIGGCLSFVAPPSLAASIRTATTTRTLQRANWRLHASQDDDDDDAILYDVAVIGSGPASCSLAALLAASPDQPKVVLLSKYADKRWIPNYGCWTEEWTVLDKLYQERGVPGLMELGVDVKWKDTDCFFGETDNNGNNNAAAADGSEGSFRRTVGREYLRVFRDGLKKVFYGDDQDRKYTVITQDVAGKVVNTNMYLPAHQSVTFHEQFTELTLKRGDDDESSSSRTIKAKIVVDGTGAESPFTIRDNRDREGYQIAYGVECHVAGSGVTDTMVGDYDRSKMTLFDFRSEPWRTAMNDEKEIVRQPTFNYVMPLSKDVIFFEETSLVANPAMSFQECKDRLTERLKSQNVQITNVLEEEFCYIPMGGGLPRKGQRIVPIGAASGLVHPATGYQIGRALASNLDVSEQILTELKRPASEFDPDSAAARIIGRIWTPEAIRQRNFAVFGGEFFMQLDVNQLREFFAGFFQVEPAMWGGFLAGWKNLPGYEDHKDWFARLKFGVVALTKLPPKIALTMVGHIISYALKDGLGQDLIQSVTPLAGAPEAYDDSLDFRQNQGDLAAKDEAMSLLCACNRCEEAANSKEEETEIISA